MQKLTKKQRIAQEESWAQEMLALEARAVDDAEKQIVEEIAHAEKMGRTRGGFFEDSYGGRLVVADEVTQDLAKARLFL